MTRPTAVVTGAAARVGRAIALELAAAGFDLVLHYRTQPDEVARVVAECAALGARCLPVAADLATAEGRAVLVNAVRAHTAQVHALINNASVFYPVPFAEVDDAEWERVLAVNLLAPFALSRDLLPLLRSADSTSLGAPPEQHAVVVHLCDIGAERPVSGYVHYSVSKAGLVMLVKAMAVELAPAIRTVGVSPGQVAWPETYDDPLREKLRKRIPLQRVGSPEDVASLVRYLVTRAHYLNGVVVPVDGGLAVRY